MKIKPSPPERRPHNHSDEYTEYLASPEWAETRRLALIRAHHCCEGTVSIPTGFGRCRVTKNLEVHHLRYDSLGAEAWGDLEVLCHSCHLAADRRRAGARRRS